MNWIGFLKITGFGSKSKKTAANVQTSTGQIFKGWTWPGRTFKVRTYKGQTFKARTCAGQTHKGQTCTRRTCEGQSYRPVLGTAGISDTPLSLLMHCHG
jgi:hypothetical protein